MGMEGSTPEPVRRRRHRPPPGTAPGSVLVDPSASPSVIRVMAYGPEACREEKVAGPQGILEFLGKWPVTWVDVEGLGDASTILQIGEIFELHRLALEDVVSAHERAKVEHYGDHLFILARMMNPLDASGTEQLGMFLGRNFVLTFQERQGDGFDPLRERIRTAKGRIRGAGPDYLAYALLDAVVDGYFPVVEHYGEQLEAIELATIRRPDMATMAGIRRIKRELAAMRRAIWPLREAMNVLVRDPADLLQEETRIHLRDCYDHTVHVMEFLETYREMSSDLTSLYLSSLSNRMNEVMKVLTIIATVFIPLTFIAGVYGMNFHTERSPWNMPELDWRWGYPFCLGLMAAIGVILLLFFWKKGWLSSFSSRREGGPERRPRRKRN